MYNILNNAMAPAIPMIDVIMIVIILILIKHSISMYEGYKNMQYEKVFEGRNTQINTLSELPPGRRSVVEDQGFTITTCQ